MKERVLIEPLLNKVISCIKKKYTCCGEIHVTSKVSIKCEHMILFLAHDTCLLILAHSLLKEICLAFQGDVLHEVKRVLDIKYLRKRNDDHKHTSIPEVMCA